MKLSIQSDGTPYGTKIVDEAGNDLSTSVASVAWRHAAGELPQAEVFLAMTPNDAIGTQCRIYGPTGKEVRRIEYADGTVDEYPED